MCWADKNSGVTMWRSSQPKAALSIVPAQQVQTNIHSFESPYCTSLISGPVQAQWQIGQPARATNPKQTIQTARVSCISTLFSWLGQNSTAMITTDTVNLVASIPLAAASSSKFALLLPPLTQLLRNVTLWSDYYLRWSSVPSALFAPTGNSDLDLYSMVTTDDFWEGAFRLEREHRIKLEDSLNQFRINQQMMINNVKSFMFDRALNLSEEELNTILFDFGKQSVEVDVVSGEEGALDPTSTLDNFLTAAASGDLGNSNEEIPQADELLFTDSDSCDKIVLMEGDVDDEGGSTPTVVQESAIERDDFSEPTFIV
eukprot:gene24289-30610_t